MTQSVTPTRATMRIIVGEHRTISSVQHSYFRSLTFGMTWGRLHLSILRWEDRRPRRYDGRCERGSQAQGDPEECK